MSMWNNLEELYREIIGINTFWDLKKIFKTKKDPVKYVIIYFPPQN